jgi:ABC-2 type transport system ATP-binding protein
MIEAVDLSKAYDEHLALKKVGFKIEDNEIVGLLGPNGAGKTTLMKVLTGYLQPTEGRAVIDGKDVLEKPIEVQAVIGYLPENAPLYPDMLVQEYLRLIADLRLIPPGGQPALISEAIRRTGLEGYLVHPIGKLSKGYRQRVGLAQAILHRPKVLILDEPTSGLDPNQIVEIRRLIRELAKNATVLLSTHILSEVEVTCERVLIIIDGELRADARLDELRAAHAALVSVEGSASGVEAALRELPGVSSVSRAGDADGGAGTFVPYRVEGAEKDLCPAIFDLVKARGWRIAELRPDLVTLEARFRELSESSSKGA